MAHLRCDFRSETLDMNTSMTVVLPEEVPMSSVRVVYLFHGLADNCTGWSRYTSIERHAREHGVALVIPEVQRSFYADMRLGLDYFSFVHDELADICVRFFGFSKEREKTYVMGLSMGGYAALKCAFSTPGRYAGCAGFSALTDIGLSFKTASEGSRKEWEAIFGGAVPPEADLGNLAASLVSAPGREETLPPVYLACGEDDPLFFHSERMAGFLNEKGFNVRFEHWKGGHDWDFWDSASKRAFELFFGETKR